MCRVTAMILRKFSAQEHDTDRAVTVVASTWDVSFTECIRIYLYTM